MKFFRKTYENGLRLVFQKVGKNKIASACVAVGVGSRDEDESNFGISHFIEHMNFKGTKNFSAKELKFQFDNLGAYFNGMTGEEDTIFVAQCLNEKIEQVLKLLAELTFGSTYDEKEIEKERKVIFEEIDTYKDDPGRVAYEKFKSDFFASTSMSHSVIGTKKILKSITRKDILDYVKKNYVASKTVVSIVGNFSARQVDKMVQKCVCPYFSGARKVPKIDESIIIVPQKKFDFVQKDVSHSTVVIGFPVGNLYSKDCDAKAFCSYTLGGTMSSRLYQKIREEKGFVYNIHCGYEISQWGGSMQVFFSTAEKNVKPAISLVKKEIENYVKFGITDEEMNRTKIYLKTCKISSSDKIFNKNISNAEDILTYDKVKTLEERLSIIEKMTKEEVNSAIKSIFDFSHVVAVAVSKNVDKTVFDVLK